MYTYSYRYKVWHVTKGIVYACEVPRPHELWEVIPCCYIDAIWYGVYI